MYDNVRDADSYLKNTVIMYDGRPVYTGAAQVLADGTIGIAILFLPKMRDSIVVSLEDPKLNFREFKLGYVNAFNCAGYLTRTTGRIFRQGLCQQNVTVDREFQNHTGQSFGAVSKRPEFVDAMAGIYPTFEECVLALKDNPELRSMAFSRRFALYRDLDLGYFELRYRGERIAWGDPRAFNLPEEFKYLTEVIQQVGVTIR